jgi:hypothetical protein
MKGESTYATESITKLVDGQDNWKRLSYQTIWNMVCGLQGGLPGDLPKDVVIDAIGVSSGPCALYPTVLQTLQVPSEWYLGFRLFDGRFIYDNEYFSVLKSCKTNRRRSTVRQNSVTNLPDIKPSNNGAHQEIYPTCQKRIGFLEVQMAVRIGEIVISLDMKECLLGFYELGRTDQCQHDANETMLDRKYHPYAVETCVERPYPADSNYIRKIAVAQTKGDPTAQLLCCQQGYKAILMKDCCLNCAFEQSLNQKFKLIIVS